MKKLLIGLVSAVCLSFFLITPLSSFGYIAPDALFNRVINRSVYLTAPTDGIYLVYTPYVCKINPSAPGLSLLTMLDKSYLSSGAGYSTFTWQGVERDSNITLTDVSDVVGFSQTYAYSTTNSSFVYSIITCIPVVEGDSFRFNFLPNSDFVTNSNSTDFFYCFLPYCTGVSKVYESFSSTSSECKYITKSDNQHFACFNNPDGTLSYGGYKSNNSTSSSNLSSVYFYNFCDLYTTTYGLSKNSEISVTPKSHVIDFSFSVYEIFTDGTSTPGIGGDNPVGTTPGGGTVGDITVNVDMSETNSKLDSLIAAVQALPAEIWDCFKVGLGISSDSSSGGSSGGISGGASSVLPPSDSDMNLDSEKVDSVLDSVSSDMGSILKRTRGAFNFFWSFTNDFITATSFVGLAGFSLLLTTIYWLMNR